MVSIGETEDLDFDASASEVKAALEAIPAVGIVNVTREDLGGDLYSWIITFTEPATAACKIGKDAGKDETSTLPVLSFPLLYAGGGESNHTLGLGTLGTGGSINATRLRRGTLGSVTGEVRW